MGLRLMQKDDEPVEREVLATAIVKIAEAAAALRQSGINEKGVIVLLHDHTGLSKRDIKAVLTGLNELRRMYCR